MDIKKILDNLTILEYNIEHSVDSFKELKQYVRALNEDANATIEDIKLRKRNQARVEYDDIRKEFNDLILEIERLEKAYNRTGNPKIKRNLEYKKNRLQELKALKSNSYWEKVIIGREYKSEKMHNRLMESLEYDNLQKIIAAVSFIQSETDYGRLTINGEQVDASDPAGIIQSVDEFMESRIGTELEHAFYFNANIQPGHFIVVGIRGENPHVGYCFEEGEKIKIVDPFLIETFLPKYANQGFISKDNINQVVNLYKKHIPGYYEVFDNLDFLIGQPISLFEDLIIQNWDSSLLGRPCPIQEQPQETEETFDDSELAMSDEEVARVNEPFKENEPNGQMQESMLFWTEAEQPEAPIPNNGANITTADLQKRNAEAKTDVIENKLKQLEEQIADLKEQIAERNENIQNINMQLENTTNESNKLAGKNRIQQIKRQIQTIQQKIDRLENQASELRNTKESITKDSEQNESVIIREAKTPMELALSGSVGSIFNYLLNGVSTGNPSDDYVAEKLKESPIIRNLLFKYDRELQKVNPNKDIISSLKLKLKSEINKFKKNR